MCNEKDYIVMGMIALGIIIGGIAGVFIGGWYLINWIFG